MAIIKCEMCGSDIHVTDGTTEVECDVCGTKQRVPLGNDQENNSEDSLKQFNGGTEYNEIHEILKNEDWESATKYCDDLLKKDNTDAIAYLGKLLAELKVHSLEDLASYTLPFENRLNCIKTMQYAPEELKNELQELINIGKKESEEKIRAAKYNALVNSIEKAETEEEYRTLAESLKDFSGYKAADSLIEDCKIKLSELQEKKVLEAEEKARAEAEKAERIKETTSKAKGKLKIIIPVVILLLVVILGVSINNTSKQNIIISISAEYRPAAEWRRPGVILDENNPYIYVKGHKANGQTVNLQKGAWTINEPVELKAGADNSVEITYHELSTTLVVHCEISGNPDSGDTSNGTISYKGYTIPLLNGFHKAAYFGENTYVNEDMSSFIIVSDIPITSEGENVDLSDISDSMLKDITSQLQESYSEYGELLSTENYFTSSGMPVIVMGYYHEGEDIPKLKLATVINKDGEKTIVIMAYEYDNATNSAYDKLESIINGIDYNN